MVISPVGVTTGGVTTGGVTGSGVTVTTFDVVATSVLPSRSFAVKVPPVVSHPYRVKVTLSDELPENCGESSCRSEQVPLNPMSLLLVVTRMV